MIFPLILLDFLLIGSPILTGAPKNRTPNISKHDEMKFSWSLLPTTLTKTAAMSTFHNLNQFFHSEEIQNFDEHHKDSMNKKSNLFSTPNE